MCFFLFNFNFNPCPVSLVNLFYFHSVPIAGMLFNESRISIDRKGKVRRPEDKFNWFFHLLQDQTGRFWSKWCLSQTLPRREVWQGVIAHREEKEGEEDDEEEEKKEGEEEEEEEEEQGVITHREEEEGLTLPCIYKTHPSDEKHLYPLHSHVEHWGFVITGLNFFEISKQDCG